MKTLYKNKDKAHLEANTSGDYDILYFNNKILGVVDFDFDFEPGAAREILHKIFQEVEMSKMFKEEEKGDEFLKMQEQIDQLQERMEEIERKELYNSSEHRFCRLI